MPSSSLPGLPPRLLIVDDEPKNLRLLADIFAGEYRLSLATSGARALELLDITPDIELVLLDVMMPVMDGLTVYERIRQQPSRRDLPIIFITARHDVDLEMRALAAGASDYLHKPVHVGLARTRVQLQITLSRQRQELQRAREAADAGNKAKSQFLTGISHELRTPLNAILGFSQVLELDDTLSGSQQSQVREIREAGAHLLALINDILDLGKIEASRLDLQLQALDVMTLAESCLRLCEPLAAKRRVVLSFSGAPGTPWVWADPTRTRQVLVNLLSNAIKFNREGGPVQLILMPGSDGMVRFEVQDDGPGIDPELAPHLFEPFRRGVDGVRRNIEGTGIGLTICKRLVESMKGRIDFHSQPGQGACFGFTLPVAHPIRQSLHNAAPDAARAPAAASAPASAPAPTSPTRPDTPEDPARNPQRVVVCIDDNPANLRLLEIVLRRLSGLKVVTDTNPEMALTLAAQHRPDLMLVDIQMPEVDGFEVLRRLRAVPKLQDMPIAALSANATEDDIRDGLAAGFSAYYTKPFDVHTLLASVSALVGLDQSTAAAAAERRHT